LAHAPIPVLPPNLPVVGGSVLSVAGGLDAAEEEQGWIYADADAAANEAMRILGFGSAGASIGPGGGSISGGGAGGGVMLGGLVELEGHLRRAYLAALAPAAAAGAAGGGAGGSLSELSAGLSAFFQRNNVVFAPDAIARHLSTVSVYGPEKGGKTVLVTCLLGILVGFSHHNRATVAPVRYHLSNRAPAADPDAAQEDSVTFVANVARPHESDVGLTLSAAAKRMQDEMAAIAGTTKFRADAIQVYLQTSKFRTELRIVDTPGITGSSAKSGGLNGAAAVADAKIQQKMVGEMLSDIMATHVQDPRGTSWGLIVHSAGTRLANCSTADIMQPILEQGGRRRVAYAFTSIDTIGIHREVEKLRTPSGSGLALFAASDVLLFRVLCGEMPDSLFWGSLPALRPPLLRATPTSTDTRAWPPIFLLACDGTAIQNARVGPLAKDQAASAMKADGAIAVEAAFEPADHLAHFVANSPCDICGRAMQPAAQKDPMVPRLAIVLRDIVAVRESPDYVKDEGIWQHLLRGFGLAALRRFVGNVSDLGTVRSHRFFVAFCKQLVARISLEAAALRTRILQAPPNSQRPGKQIDDLVKLAGLLLHLEYCGDPLETAINRLPPPARPAETDLPSTETLRHVHRARMRPVATDIRCIPTPFKLTTVVSAAVLDAFAPTILPEKDGKDPAPGGQTLRAPQPMMGGYLSSRMQTVLQAWRALALLKRPQPLTLLDAMAGRAKDGSHLPDLKPMLLKAFLEFSQTAIQRELVQSLDMTVRRILATVIDTVCGGILSVPRWQSMAATSSGRTLMAHLVDFLQEHFVNRFARLTAQQFREAAVRLHHNQSSSAILWWRAILPALYPKTESEEAKLAGRLSDHKVTHQQTAALARMATSDPSKRDNKAVMAAMPSPSDAEAKLAFERLALTTDQAMIEWINCAKGAETQAMSTAHILAPSRTSEVPITDADAGNTALFVRCVGLLMPLVGGSVPYLETPLETLLSPQPFDGNVFLRFVLERHLRRSRARLADLLRPAPAANPVVVVNPMAVNPGAAPGGGVLAEVQRMLAIDFRVPVAGVPDTPPEPTYDVAPPLTPQECDHVAAEAYRLDPPSRQHEAALRQLETVLGALTPSITDAILTAHALGFAV
jgi:hypothetical protein